jgi:hypothetical protein
MMAGFTVPNATDYATGGIIASLDQSEPDSLDFSSLADRRDFVVTGGSATSVTSAATNATPAYLNVVLAASEVRINGVYGTISSSTIVVPLAPTNTDSRFDLIVAFNDNGTFQYAVVSGTASSTNPVFPTPTDTQIPLYAVYVKNTYNTSFSTELLVDKRTFGSTSLTRSGSTAPSGSLGSTGDVYLNTTTNANNGQSQVYVKTGASTWTNLATYVAMASANTANTLVQRDASGNFIAGDITATSFTGSGAALTNISGTNLTAGTVGTTQLTDASVTTAKLATGAPRAGFNSTVNAVAGSYTLVASDLGKLVEVASGSACNLTIPTDSVAFTTGDRIDIIQTDLGQVTLVPGAGVTLNTDSGKRKLLSQWAACTLIKRGSNSWVAIGNLTD